MAVVRSPDFLRALIRETALATLIHQRRLTPSCGGHAPTAERTVGPARMIAESLTPKPGIREHNLPGTNILGRLGMDLLTHLTKEPLPFAALLGIEIVSAVPDKIVAQMMDRDELCTRPA